MNIIALETCKGFKQFTLWYIFFTKLEINQIRAN